MESLDDLTTYFTLLIKRVEDSDIQNNGKDDSGFYKPTRTVLLQKLSMLRDLHSKPNAKGLVKAAWQYVATELPPDWLVLSPEQKAQLKRMLG